MNLIGSHLLTSNSILQIHGIFLNIGKSMKMVIIRLLSVCTVVSSRGCTVLCGLLIQTNEWTVHQVNS